MDDIIFGSTSSLLCDDFAKLMGSEFALSMMGEQSFFLWFQIKQPLSGTMISQEKFMKDI